MHLICCDERLNQLMCYSAIVSCFEAIDVVVQSFDLLERAAEDYEYRRDAEEGASSICT
jgi:hypothetical protein